MNRLIMENKMDEALKIVRQSIALPAILGYICPAPCEKACRRKEIDQPVSICTLKRFVGEDGLKSGKELQPVLKPGNKTKVAIIGSGPAGLSASFYLAQNGFSCDVYDSNPFPGGKLRTDIKEEVLPRNVLDQEIESIKRLQVEFYQQRTISFNDILTDLSDNYQFILLTTGAETTIETKNLVPVNSSKLKELEIYKVNNCYLFVPKQVSYKSNMAVRAAALGRKASEWIMEFMDKQIVSVPEKKFNSVYKKITKDEQDEFLKEARNHFPGDASITRLEGFTKEQAIKEAERCLHCDCRKNEACVLRDLSTEYKASQRVYTLSTHQKTEKYLDSDLIVFEKLKCIKCGICIQTAQNEGDETGFAFSGRGFDVHITIPNEKSIRELTKKTALSSAKNCPTGAIALKSN